jgi:UDP-N-acetylmuramyl pentapeptide phosphotransferase/UDP-N-acetylglucosamine-1-phosphate transferase
LITACPFWLAALAWVLSLAGTYLALLLLRRFAVLDTPSARSNHAHAVPRGGGVAFIFVILLLLAYSGASLALVVAALLVACVSFTDDLKNLPVRVRLLAQFVAVVIAGYALQGRILPDAVPLLVERIFIAIGWLWFINLTNFMDGIDGITSLETIAICLGICLLCCVQPALPASLALYSAIIAAAVFGFYAFNRAPAKLFMGDVGSIPLGLLIGYVLLMLAIHGAWEAALILPAYYLSDATFTLLKRASQKKKIWQAHSEHAYQQAVRSGLSHNGVVWRISLLNAVLVVLAMLSTFSMIAGLVCLVGAYCLTACLLWRFLHGSSLK